MQVAIKKFFNKFEIKNNGVEFEIRDTAGKQVGDLYVTKSGLIWCRGKKPRAGGKPISWKKFIAAAEEI